VFPIWKAESIPNLAGCKLRHPRHRSYDELYWKRSWSVFEMRKEPKNLIFDDFADELLRETQPRALIILATAKLDNQLREVIEAFLLPRPPAASGNTDELFDGDRSPLGTFSARIKVCRRLGLIDESLARTLDTLRDVRNHAAHWISFGLSESPLRDLLRSAPPDDEKTSGRTGFRLGAP
jgi:hypothetical protein